MYRINHFLFLDELLSHWEQLYSSMGLINAKCNFSRACLFNLKFLSKCSLYHEVCVKDLICAIHVQSIDGIMPKCLYIFFIKKFNIIHEKRWMC